MAPLTTSLSFTLTTSTVIWTLSDTAGSSTSLLARQSSDKCPVNLWPSQALPCPSRVRVRAEELRLTAFPPYDDSCPADNLAKNISCFGGYARLLSKIEEVKSSVDDCIVANVGDEWQGVG